MPSRSGRSDPSDTWVPGAQPILEHDGAGAAAALELLAKQTEPEREVEVDAEAASTPADDDRPIGELIEDLAELNETLAEPDDEDAE